MKITVEFDNLDSLAAALEYFASADITFRVADVAVPETVKQSVANDKLSDTLSLRDYLRRS